MAYRELGVIELREVWRQYSQGRACGPSPAASAPIARLIAKIVVKA